MVHPAVVGHSKRLFREGSETKSPRLLETRTFGLGVVLTNRPASKDGAGSAPDEQR